MSYKKNRFRKAYIKFRSEYKVYKAKHIVDGEDINVRVQKVTSLSDKIAWIGTSFLMVGPYLLSYQIGFIINAIGIALLTPQVYKAKQWNLVLLNITSTTGYILQIFNII